MSHVDLRACCHSILVEGKRWHRLAVGIVSRIRDFSYEVVAVDSETGIPQAGDIFALNATYCMAVVNDQTSVAITEVGGNPGMCLHPLYQEVPCEAYIASPIFVRDRVWGTLNYTSFEIREAPFAPRDIEFNERQAREIAALVESRDL